MLNDPLTCESDEAKDNGNIVEPTKEPSTKDEDTLDSLSELYHRLTKEITLEEVSSDVQMIIAIR